jgi:hypothetical protein
MMGGRSARKHPDMCALKASASVTPLSSLTRSHTDAHMWTPGGAAKPLSTGNPFLSPNQGDCLFSDGSPTLLHHYCGLLLPTGTSAAAGPQ